MLLEFKCSNNKSIGEEIKFSMLASVDDTDKDRLIEYDDFYILPYAVIYGANGSGKSNLIGAMHFMQSMVTRSILNQPGDLLFQEPHKLMTSQTPSTYAIQFVRNGIRYAYGFSLVKGAIEDEYLYYFPNGKQTNVFKREGLDVELGSKFKKGFNSSLDVLKENRLFLSCAANFSQSETLNEVFLFFKEDISFVNISYNSHAEFTADMIRKDDRFKDLVLRMFRLLGIDIKDIVIREKEIGVAQSEDELKYMSYGNVYSSKRPAVLDIEFVYERFSVSYDEESVGTKKLFQMAGLLINAIALNKILIFDEIETSLHESFMPVILRFFFNYDCNCSSQLIFTTHDTGLLSKNLFRRDQIWFTQLRSEDRTTDLYSLSDIHNVRKSENFEKGYVSGRYGAVPMLNKQFAEDFCMEIKEGGNGE